MADIEGLHHVTAIAGEPQTNINFYTGVLGLRLVKVTVNFDDPTTYHLYYGDGQGHPGTIMTFFPWPGAFKGRIGTGQLNVTSFAVPEKALPYWRKRLNKSGVEFEEATSDFGEEMLFLGTYQLPGCGTRSYLGAWPGADRPCNSWVPPCNAL